MLPLDYFLFLQIILFLFITPGTPRIVIISYAMNYGTRKCIWIALGDVTANLIQATLVIFFIGSFIADNRETLNILKWFGIAYLFYLSYDIYKSRPKDFDKTSDKSKTLLSFFKDGFIVAGTSPKAWIFFPLIFPQFINFNENYITQFLILIITYIILDFLSLIGYAILAEKLLTWIKANPRVINSISACVLIFIAIFIGFTQHY
jgi:homoserine/homoserine lactone efflux protein|tara:strand:- start:407 stop:1021 length:615 start_codon:yes stop_codon:yes gene_type:complete